MGKQHHWPLWKYVDGVGNHRSVINQDAFLHHCATLGPHSTADLITILHTTQQPHSSWVQEWPRAIQLSAITVDQHILHYASLFSLTLSISGERFSFQSPAWCQDRWGWDMLVWEENGDSPVSRMIQWLGFLYGNMMGSYCSFWTDLVI